MIKDSDDLVRLKDEPEPFLCRCLITENNAALAISSSTRATTLSVTNASQSKSNVFDAKSPEGVTFLGRRAWRENSRLLGKGSTAAN